MGKKCLHARPGWLCARNKARGKLRTTAAARARINHRAREGRDACTHARTHARTPARAVVKEISGRIKLRRLLNVDFRSGAPKKAAHKHRRDLNAALSLPRVRFTTRPVLVVLISARSPARSPRRASLSRPRKMLIDFTRRPCAGLFC